MLHLHFLFPMLCYMNISIGLQMSNTENVSISLTVVLHTNQHRVPLVLLVQVFFIRTFFKKNPITKTCQFSRNVFKYYIILFPFIMVQMKISKYCCFKLYPFRTSFHVLATEHFWFPPLLAGQEGFQFLFSLSIKTSMACKNHEKRKKNLKKQWYCFA